MKKKTKRGSTKSKLQDRLADTLFMSFCGYCTDDLDDCYGIASIILANFNVSFKKKGKRK